MGFLTVCNNHCKFRRGTVEASLDLESNAAVCNYCHEELTNINDFAKETMKSLGYILKNNKKSSFLFKCLECNKTVSCSYESEKVCGSDCELKKCKFNITEEMISVLKKYREVNNDE